MKPGHIVWWKSGAWAGWYEVNQRRSDYRLLYIESLDDIMCNDWILVKRGSLLWASPDELTYVRPA